MLDRDFYFEMLFFMLRVELSLAKGRGFLLKEDPLYGREGEEFIPD